MSLIKSVDTNYGISADYWRIESITIDKKRKEASFITYLYANQKATNSLEYRVIAIADKPNKEEPFDKYFFDGNDYTDIYNACYLCAKEVDEFFSDATDS